MDFNKIGLFINTIKYLRSIQIYYRIYYVLRNRLFGYNVKKGSINKFKPIVWKNKFHYEDSYFEKKNSFTFLNIAHSFSGKIDWNIKKFGKLWTYNLNYFDFLNQKNIQSETGLIFIKDFIENDDFLKDGKEPYPISLRGINWVKFLSSHQVKDEVIDNTLHFHYRILLKSLEYHLLGNHLLENAFSLLFGAYYFQDEKLYTKSYNLLISELNEQILKDGAHFELSPMYHQIILSRLLDSIQLIKLNSDWKKDGLLFFLQYRASLMISWLRNVTYCNGKIPMVNDATYNIAPSSTQLFSYSRILGIHNPKIPLSDSGYRKIISNTYELFIDVGNVGPDYQLAHAHSDSFNFELIKSGIPIFVDTGISTYEKSNRRQQERSTESHNTVDISSQNQTQVWGGFRVARRAKIIELNEGNSRISATHDGYSRKDLKHQRVFEWSDYQIIITDELNKSSSNKAQAHFHLHSSIIKPVLKNDKVMLTDRNIVISFIGHNKIRLTSYDLSFGFNKKSIAFKLIVDFDKSLKTIIDLPCG
ncbi:heparinase II/III family protein [Akkermansiaceae bacterium]|nr:heparinase II/III family protein [Akkermansiaceae bacterium]